MKVGKEVIVFVFLFFCFISSFSQIWPKTYFPYEGTFPLSVTECYDKGYLIGGWYINSAGQSKNGLLLKTDLNGEILWYKMLGEINDGTGVRDVNLTNDNGFIISGYTKRTDGWGDPFIMKLNYCGEKEWCRIFNIGQNRYDDAISIHQIPGGYIVYVFEAFPQYSNTKTHLFRVDNNGYLVWQQTYCQNDTLMNGGEGYKMTVTPDYHFLIDGFCYYPDSGTIGPRYLRPLIIKVDSAGNADWQLPWRYVSGQHFYGTSSWSIVDNQHTIYSCGRHIEDNASPPGDRPTMLKTDYSGNEISFHDMVPNSWQAVFSTINWFADSTIALGGGWLFSYNDRHEGVFKVDRSGSILASVDLYSSIYTFSDATTTFDNKLLLVSGQNNGSKFTIYAWKLNSDLEYDTLYTHPYVYDSLCPNPIASDTIPLDCLIVGMDEPFKNPETGKLKVYPNPARDMLHIVIPEQLKTENQNPFFNLSTVYHLWHSAILEIYDLFGKKMFSKEVIQSEKEIAVDVSLWSGGMYVVRLVYNGQTVSNTKIIIEP